MNKNRIKNQLEYESMEYKKSNIDGEEFTYNMEDIKQRAKRRCQVLTMDGCSGELKVILSIIEDEELIGILPTNTGFLIGNARKDGDEDKK
jgi:hypothetical protein